MKVYTCLLLFRIFAYTNSLTLSRLTGDQRSINLQENPVQKYSSQKYTGDSNNIDNEHNYERRARAKQTDKNKNMKFVFRTPTVETLTDFLQETVNILNTYEDTAFEDFFHILDNEIRKYHYRGCKFSELTQNYDTRTLLARSLKSIRGKPVSFIKENINEIVDNMADGIYDKNIKELLNHINSLYANSKPDFQNILNELKYFRKIKSMKSHNDLVQAIKHGVRTIFFDHYTLLDSNTRRELRERIETFWKQFTINPETNSKIDDIPYTDPVIKSVVKGIKSLNDPESTQNEPQMKLKNNSEKTVSEELQNEQFQTDEPEMNESINEFWNPNADSVNDAISSGQTLDSSSNSIKNSQERHEEYNTQRYITLYTEAISFITKTTKTAKVIPMNVITTKVKAKKRPTTTDYMLTERDESQDGLERIEDRPGRVTDDKKRDLSNSGHDTETGLALEPVYEPRAKGNYDIPRKLGKAELRSKRKHKNADIFSQYDAVIDVQLANTELLKSLGNFRLAEMDTKYDTTLYQSPVTQSEPVPAKPSRPRAVQSHTEIRPTAHSKLRSRYLKSYESFDKKQSDDSNRREVTKKSHSVKRTRQNKKEKQTFIARRTNNNTIGGNDFDKYVIKRINALESELNELKQTHYFRNAMADNNTVEVELNNVTDNYRPIDKDISQRKYLKDNIDERLSNENHDFHNEEIQTENIDEHSTKMYTNNTETTTNNTPSTESIVIKEDAVEATVNIDNVTTSTPETTSTVSNDRKDINEVPMITDAASTEMSVTETTGLASVLTTPLISMTRSTMAYSEPSYYDYPVAPRGKSKHDIDPFEHRSDGIDFKK